MQHNHLLIRFKRVVLVSVRGCCPRVQAENSLRLKTLKQDLATAKAEANSLQQRLDVADRQAKDLLVELGTLRSLKLQVWCALVTVNRNNALGLC